VDSAPVRSGKQSIVCEQASFLLGEVLGEHPGMKLIVAREVERFMFRPGLAERALYYAIVFLNQMILTRRADQGVSLSMPTGPANICRTCYAVSMACGADRHEDHAIGCNYGIGRGANNIRAHWEAASLQEEIARCGTRYRDVRAGPCWRLNAITYHHFRLWQPPGCDLWCP
jgi:hypothetical protein